MNDFVLATKDQNARPAAWNFYESTLAAESARALIPPDSLFGPADGYEVIPVAEFFARQDAFYLGQAIEEITPEEYTEKLEILPPLQWLRVGGIERFLMCEFLEGNFTRQYAKFGSRCFMKIVDAYRPSTWIDAAMVGAYDRSL